MVVAATAVVIGTFPGTFPSPPTITPVLSLEAAQPARVALKNKFGADALPLATSPPAARRQAAASIFMFISSSKSRVC